MISILLQFFYSSEVTAPVQSMRTYFSIKAGMFLSQHTWINYVTQHFNQAEPFLKSGEIS